MWRVHACHVCVCVHVLARSVYVVFVCAWYTCTLTNSPAQKITSSQQIDRVVPLSQELDLRQRLWFFVFLLSSSIIASVQVGTKRSAPSSPFPP